MHAPYKVDSRDLSTAAAVIPAQQGAGSTGQGNAAQGSLQKKALHFFQTAPSHKLSNLQLRPFYAACM